MSADDVSMIVPCDDGLNKSICTTARRNCNLIVVKHWERTFKIDFINLSERFHKCVILTITGGICRITLSVYLNLNAGYRLQAITCRNHIA